jgi:hypothetical protein
MPILYSSMEEVEVVTARGHPLVAGTHPTTFEVTRAEHLSHAGDCIIAIGADKAAADLSPAFRSAIRKPGSVLTTHLSCRDIEYEVTSLGHPDFVLDHEEDLVWRRSSYIDGRTIGIHSDATARSLPRDLVALLRDGARLVVTMTVTGREDTG